MRTAALIAAAAIVATPALASTPYDLDKSHAHIDFQIKHLGYSYTRGEFDEFDAEIVIDEENPERSSVSFTIQAASIDTNWPERDAHLRNADFFNVEEFPTITFVSTDVDQQGPNRAMVTGDLTMLGVTKPVTFEAILNQKSVHPMSGKETAGFTATASIERSDWGMTYALPAVSDTVQITVNLEATKAE